MKPLFLYVLYRERDAQLDFHCKSKSCVCRRHRLPTPYTLHYVPNFDGYISFSLTFSLSLSFSLTVPVHYSHRQNEDLFHMVRHPPLSLPCRHIYVYIQSSNFFVNPNRPLFPYVLFLFVENVLKEFRIRVYV